MGVFATRSPHRPNPVGLSLVKLLEVKPDGLVVSGVDLVDGTPILDIKPYLPFVESIPEATSGWPGEVAKDPIIVEFSPQAEAKLTQWQQESPELSLRQVIEETLKLDPRPVVYRGYEAGDSPYRNQHAVRLYNGDIHFKFETANIVRVLDILFTNN